MIRFAHLYRHTGPQLHDPVDHHQVASLEALVDEPLILVPAASLHRPQRRFLLGIYHPDKSPLGPLHDRPLRHQYRLRLQGAKYPHPYKLAGPQ